jgi:hypothetical protein
MVTAPLLGCEYSSKIPSILHCLDFAPRRGDGPNVDWMKAAALFFRVCTGELAVEDDDASLIMWLIGIGRGEPMDYEYELSECRYEVGLVIFLCLKC